MALFHPIIILSCDCQTVLFCCSRHRVGVALTQIRTIFGLSLLVYFQKIGTFCCNKLIKANKIAYFKYNVGTWVSYCVLLFKRNILNANSTYEDIIIKYSCIKWVLKLDYMKIIIFIIFSIIRQIHRFKTNDDV